MRLQGCLQFDLPLTRLVISQTACECERFGKVHCVIVVFIHLLRTAGLAIVLLQIRCFDMLATMTEKISWKQQIVLFSIFLYLKSLVCMRTCSLQWSLKKLPLFDILFTLNKTCQNFKVHSVRSCFEELVVRGSCFLAIFDLGAPSMVQPQPRSMYASGRSRVLLDATSCLPRDSFEKCTFKVLFFFLCLTTF